VLRKQQWNAMNSFIKFLQGIVDKLFR